MRQSTHLPITQRVARCLASDGPLPLREVAERCSISLASVARAASCRPELFERRGRLVALAAHEPAPTT